MEFEEKPYIVYVKTDDANRITDINSSAFLKDVSDWTEIDRGNGVKYKHAQFNYLNKQIADARGIYRYRLVLGAPQERTASEMDADYVPPIQKPSDAERIAQLEEKLKAAEIMLGIEV